LNINEYIFSGIFSHLASYKSELPQVLWPNIVYRDDLPDNYLKVDILPAETRTVGVSSLNQHIGIVQIMVNVREDQGAILAAQYADKVLSLFPRNTRINESGIRINIDKQGYISPAMQNQSWYSVAVSIPYNVIVK